MGTLLEQVEAALAAQDPDAGVLVLGGEPLRPLALREGNPDAKVRSDVVVVLSRRDRS
jgi:hypothetical protein